MTLGRRVAGLLLVSVAGWLLRLVAGRSAPAATPTPRAGGESIRRRVPPPTDPAPPPKQEAERGWPAVAQRLTRLATEYPKRVLALSAVVLLVAAPVGLTAFTALDPFEFSDPSTESARAVERIESAAGLRADAGVVISVTTPADADRVAEQLESVAGVGAVRSGSPASPDGRRRYLIAPVDAARDSSEITEALEARLGDAEGVLIGGAVVAEHQIAKQSESDLRRAELLAFPVLFVLSLLFFRGLVASSLPLIIGGVAIVGALFAMRLIHEVFGLSVLAINVVTAIGFGLSIDYSLFTIARFREELARGRDVPAALGEAIHRSGHAIVFSGLTVACAMGSLLLFPQRFLQSMGVAGAAVALVAATAALVVLPAILALLGTRVNALSPGWLQRSRRRSELPDSDGAWYRLSRKVMARPVPVALAATALLVAAGIPALGMNFVPGDAGVLPPEQSAGALDRQVRADFPADPTHPTVVQLDTTVGPEVAAYRDRLLGVPGVVAVSDPLQAGPGVVAMELVGDRGRFSEAGKALVREVRAVPAPAAVRVGGLTASQLDEERSVARHIPIAALALSLSTLILLFAMTRSVLLPIKALLMNFLSLAAAMGLLVLVFQDGFGADLLGIESQGGIQIGIAVLVFAAAFGLSTDYGVFSISRIRELRLAGIDNTEAVALGLERTGRLITSAAALFAVAMGALITAELVGVQTTGFGVAAAVLIDAALVRTLLVPSLMALLGEWNWWAPGRR